MNEQREPWVMPAWMEPLRELIGNTGGNSIEELINDRHTDARNNVVLAGLIVAVTSQIGLLSRLHVLGLLPSDVLAEVAGERIRQDAKWGEQNHPDGTGGPGRREAADAARRWTNMQAAEHTLTWADVFEEEVAEVLAESDPAKLRAELIQVAAVAAAWVEAIDRRGGAA